ncbi:hypothetical protein KDAU_63920 [Dictyobacter aurantiacus]|uniref:Uncharacterized protein n=1 Tax=Dictyobacter aurantiacus TaxID=1936993 RepID=A0A401ZQA4_9CHLR|nr:hypothetical protein KDAU_63920 [Dictyobacter aurantiacus]
MHVLDYGTPCLYVLEVGGASAPPTSNTYNPLEHSGVVNGEHLGRGR